MLLKEIPPYRYHFVPLPCQGAEEAWGVVGNKVFLHPRTLRHVYLVSQPEHGTATVKANFKI